MKCEKKESESYPSMLKTVPQRWANLMRSWGSTLIKKHIVYFVMGGVGLIASWDGLWQFLRSFSWLSQGPITRKYGQKLFWHCPNRQSAMSNTCKANFPGYLKLFPLTIFWRHWSSPVKLILHFFQNFADNLNTGWYHHKFITSTGRQFSSPHTHTSEWSLPSSKNIWIFYSWWW